MDKARIIEEISQVAHYLWEKGWAERNAGNISVNVTGILKLNRNLSLNLESEPLAVPRPALAGNIFIITPTGSRMRELNRNTMDQLCYIRVNDDGTGISHLDSTIFESLFPLSENSSGASGASLLQTSPKPLRPSSELPAHLAIHEMLLRKSPDMNTVIHTHATELIALTQIREFCSAEQINRLLWGMHPETAMFVPEGAGFVPYTLPGTQQIAEATVKELEKYPVVIWEKHGVFATGRSVTTAFDTIDILAKSARIYFMVKQSGHEPEGLSESEIEKIRRQ